MLPKLSNSQRFVEDYKNYQKRILEVSDPELQKELTSTLLKLREKIQFVDRSHEQVFITGRIPTDISDLRTEVIKFKQSLDTKLSAWEKAQANKPAP